MSDIRIMDEAACAAAKLPRKRLRPMPIITEARTHLSLGKDAHEPRAVQPPSMGKIVELPQVGGLHHRYERRAA